MLTCDHHCTSNQTLLAEHQRHIGIKNRPNMTLKFCSTYYNHVKFHYDRANKRRRLLDKNGALPIFELTTNELLKDSCSTKDMSGKHLCALLECNNPNQVENYHTTIASSNHHHASRHIAYSIYASRKQVVSIL